jgi:hypothetical protein
MVRMLKDSSTTRTTGPSDAYVIGASMVRAAQATRQTTSRRFQVWPT